MSGAVAPAYSRRTNPPRPNHRRTASQRTPDHSGQLLGAPMKQLPPQHLRLDTERLAHRIERERPLAAGAAKPFFRFLKQALAPAILGPGIVLKTTQGIFQNRHHQPLNRCELAIFLSPAIIKLSRSHNLRDK